MIIRSQTHASQTMIPPHHYPGEMQYHLRHVWQTHYHAYLHVTPTVWLITNHFLPLLSHRILLSTTFIGLGQSNVRASSPCQYKVGRNALAVPENSQATLYLENPTGTSLHMAVLHYCMITLMRLLTTACSREI